MAIGTIQHELQFCIHINWHIILDLNPTSNIINDITFFR